MLLFNGINEPIKKSTTATKNTQLNHPDKRQEFAKEMASTQPSSLSEQLRNKDVSTYLRNQTFLEKAQEAALLQRMGVNKEKLEELKEQLEALDKMLADGTISQEAYQEQRAVIEQEIAKEYEQAQKRREEEEKSQGKL
ncbi:hypothetical protein PSECIP111854_03829 [Pseudoalteromonas sp. CIP111854]|uniref:Uncharacterized protein n=1 Tax=Pseudoalteromonas holothuriae TaxID=2963714 RepID=A0A9W4R4V2_9GAMM|nr:hypothetical protein [Pseudoalteromonas sp. CIP111854]CAH9066143.1 hypothetical protein PSECIP111854_03829 [Pseudoalteromonas sp. CIP111854]